MSQVTLSGAVIETPRDESSNCFTSLTSHIITALVVGIVMGAGAATAAYFLTQQVILWTAVAGSASFVLAGTITFVALRCSRSKSEPEVPVGTITLPDPDTDSESVKPKKHRPVKTPEEQAKKTVTPSIPSNKAVCLSEVIYGVKNIEKVDQKSLPGLIRTVDSSFPNKMLESGTVYYDPSNELPIPLARLYQEMLTHPTCGDKRDILLKLLAAELLDIYIKGDSIECVYKCLYGLDADTVRVIGDLIPTSTEFPLKCAQLCSALRNYKTTPLTKLAVKSHSEINRLVTNELGEGKFYLGAALDQGECLFNSMAQLLSSLTGEVITAKTLRLDCAAHLRNEGGYTEELLQEMEISSRELVEQGFSKTKTVSWGDAEHAQIIANKYAVQFKIYEASEDLVEERAARKELDESTGEQVVIPAVMQKVATTKTSTITPKEPTKSTPVLRIALMKSHFFPIWTDQPKT